MSNLQNLRKQAEAHNHWINSLTEDERKEWDTDERGVIVSRYPMRKPKSRCGEHNG